MGESDSVGVYPRIRYPVDCDCPNIISIKTIEPLGYLPGLVTLNSGNKIEDMVSWSYPEGVEGNP